MISADRANFSQASLVLFEGQYAVKFVSTGFARFRLRDELEYLHWHEDFDRVYKQDAAVYAIFRTEVAAMEFFLSI